MEKVTKPKVKLLASGSQLVAKQMEANEGELLPKHIANMESILFIKKGKCILKINAEEKKLEEGDAFIVPADTKHQIQAETAFIGIHFMPKEIEFKFFN